MGGTRPQAQGCLGPPGAGGWAGRTLPLEAPSGGTPISDFPPPELEGHRFLLLSPQETNSTSSTMSKYFRVN